LCDLDRGRRRVLDPHHDDVGVGRAVELEVAVGQTAGLGHSVNARLREEAPVTATEQHPQISRRVVRGDDVQVPVEIEVRHDQRSGPLAGRHPALRREGAIAVGFGPTGETGTG